MCVAFLIILILIYKCIKYRENQVRAPLMETGPLTYSYHGLLYILGIYKSSFSDIRP